MKRILVMLAVLFVAVRVAAQEANTTVRVAALRVSREIPEDKEGKLTGHQEGVTVTLVIRNARKQFIGVDGRTKLIAFTDDKGTDLLKDWPRWGMIGSPNFSADGHLCVVSVIVYTPPAPGAKTLRLKARLVMKCGENEKTVVQKGLKLEKNAKLTVGPVPWTITKVDKADWGDAAMSVSVTGKVSHDVIKELVFLDADGNTIEQSGGTRNSSGVEGHMVHEVTYNFKKKVDVVDVKVTYYDKVEALTIPVDLEIGVGM